MLAIVIRKGKRPLQGTKALVKIEIRRSLGESIILQPITPAALQPNPMHMGVTTWKARIDNWQKKEIMLI